MKIESFVKITTDRILSDREIPSYDGHGLQLLLSAFKSLGTGYAKFYKMDTLCKLGFVASEILLSGTSDRFIEREDRAVILMNSSSSLCDDRNFVRTIDDPEDYFPSPAVFVYTLPNIVTGEIAIRNRYYGETCFHVLPFPDPQMIADIVSDAFQDRVTSSAICGWTECRGDDDFEAVMFLVGADGEREWNPEQIELILNGE